MAKKRKKRAKKSPSAASSSGGASAEASPEPAAPAKPPAADPAKTSAAKRAAVAAPAEKAAPSEKAASKEPAPAAPPSHESKAPAERGNPLHAAGWAAVVIAVGLVILTFLAVLPPVSCPPGHDNCGWSGGCVATSTDVANCGACGHACASGERCQWGECSSPEPAPEE